MRFHRELWVFPSDVHISCLVLIWTCWIDQILRMFFPPKEFIVSFLMILKSCLQLGVTTFVSHLVWISPSGSLCHSLSHDLKLVGSQQRLFTPCDFSLSCLPTYFLSSTTEFAVIRVSWMLKWPFVDDKKGIFSLKQYSEKRRKPYSSCFCPRTMLNLHLLSFPILMTLFELNG